MQTTANGALLSSSGWGISIEWTDDEQRTLEACMMRFPADRFDPLQRYVRIATTLPRKGVRDVALRVRWTLLQQQLRKRTGLDVRKPGMPPMLPKTTMPIVPPLPGGAMPQSFMPPAGSVQALEGPPTIEGPIAHLLDANLAILNHFRSNMSSFKVHENTQLLVQFRDNILQILHAMEAMGGPMSQMPQLPVRLNVDLANSFLPSRPAGVLTYDGMMMPPPPQPALNAPGMVPMNGLAPGAGSHAAQTMPKPPPMGPPPMPPVAGIVGPPRGPPPAHGSGGGVPGMPSSGAPLVSQSPSLPPPPMSSGAVMGDAGVGAGGQSVLGGASQGHNDGAPPPPHIAEGDAEQSHGDDQMDSDDNNHDNDNDDNSMGD